MNRTFVLGSEYYTVNGFASTSFPICIFMLGHGFGVLLCVGFGLRWFHAVIFAALMTVTINDMAQATHVEFDICLAIFISN